MSSDVQDTIAQAICNVHPPCERHMAKAWDAAVAMAAADFIVWRPASKTDDGVVESPATPGAVPDPAAHAEGASWRPAPSSPTTDGGAAAPPGSSPQDAATTTAAPPSVLPRPFLLFRIRDVSGTSGTGVVAWGTEFPDGSAALRWNGPHPSTAAWPSVEDILAVHGHQGATVIHWLNGGA